MADEPVIAQDGSKVVGFVKEHAQVLGTIAAVITIGLFLWYEYQQAQANASDTTAAPNTTAATDTTTSTGTTTTTATGDTSPAISFSLTPGTLLNSFTSALTSAFSQGNTSGGSSDSGGGSGGQSGGGGIFGSIFGSNIRTGGSQGIEVGSSLSQTGSSGVTGYGLSFSGPSDIGEALLEDVDTLNQTLLNSSQSESSIQEQANNTNLVSQVITELSGQPAGSSQAYNQTKLNLLNAATESAGI